MDAVSSPASAKTRARRPTASSEMYARSKSSHNETEQHSTAQRAWGSWICGCVTSSHHPLATHPRPAIFSPSLLSPSPSALAPFPVHSGLDSTRAHPRPSHLGPLGPLSIESIGHLSPDRWPPIASARCHLRRSFLVPPTLGAAFSCVASEGSPPSVLLFRRPSARSSLASRCALAVQHINRPSRSFRSSHRPPFPS